MSVRKALSFSYLEKYGSYVIGFVSTMVISRILGPADIGAFSVGMGLIGIVAVIRELGISTYVIQEEDLTDERIRAAFTLTATVGFTLALGLVAASSLVGSFYGDPRVSTIIVILAVVFVVTPFGSVAQALMARDRNFGTLSWIGLLQATTAAATGIGLAWWGLGPVSLAWASVAATVLTAVLSTFARRHSHVPNFAMVDLRRVFRVGGPATATSIIEDVAASLPELILGRAQSLSATGVFSRARGLSQIAYLVLVRAANAVVFSEFSLLRREGQSIAPIYVKIAVYVTAVGWSVLGVMAVLAAPLVLVLFGPMWTEIVPVLRWLCIAAGIALLTTSAFHALLASGGAFEVLKTRLQWLPLHAVLLLVGAMAGAEAAAIAFAGSSVVNCGLLCAAVRRKVGVTIREQFSPLAASGPVAAFAVGGSALALLIPAEGVAASMLVLAAGGGGAAIGFMAGLWLTRHPLLKEVDNAWRALRQRLNRDA